MTELLAWVRSRDDTKTLHPLLVIAIFVVVFLEIHPFQDGNGRLSRVLTTLLLLRAGYAYVPYSSLETVIEQSKDSYYLALPADSGNHPHRRSRLEPMVGILPASPTAEKTQPATKARSRASRSRQPPPTVRPNTGICPIARSSNDCRRRKAHRPKPRHYPRPHQGPDQVRLPRAARRRARCLVRIDMSLRYTAQTGSEFPSDQRGFCHESDMGPH